MPHTKMKKHKHANKAVRTKRAIVEDDDGWAHVVGGRTIKSDASKRNVTKLGYDIVTYTIEEVVAEYKILKGKWDDSDACRELTDLVKPYKDNNQIKNVVVMGLGSFQTVIGDFKRTTQTQLAALTTITTALAIQDPKGFDLINSHTLVYAIHCYPAVYEQVWKKGPPAVLVGNDLKGRSVGPIDFSVRFPDIENWYESLDCLFAMPQFQE